MHIVRRMPLPLTVSGFSKNQIGFSFLVPAHPGSPGQRAVKRVCVCRCIGVAKRSQTAYVTFVDCDHCRSLILAPFDRPPVTPVSVPL